jgi:hypothetical protein
VKWAAWERCYSRNTLQHTQQTHSLHPLQITFYFALYLMRTNQYILPLRRVLFLSFFVFPEARGLTQTGSHWERKMVLDPVFSMELCLFCPVVFQYHLPSLHLTSQATLLMVLSSIEACSRKLKTDSILKESVLKPTSTTPGHFWRVERKSCSFQVIVSCAWGLKSHIRVKKV